MWPRRVRSLGDFDGLDAPRLWLLSQWFKCYAILEGNGHFPTFQTKKKSLVEDNIFLWKIKHRCNLTWDNIFKQEFEGPTHFTLCSQ